MVLAHCREALPSTLAGTVLAVNQRTMEIAMLFQAFAVLETLHAAIGIVKSNAVMTLLQWAGRSHILFCVVLAVPETHGDPALTVLLTVWALSEVIR